MANQPQQEELGAFFKAACELLLPFEAEFPPSGWQVIATRLQNGGSVSKKPAYEWSRWLEKHQDQLEALPEFQAALRLLEADQTVATRLAEYPLNSDFGVIVYSLLATLLQRQNGFSFREDIWNQLYQEMRADFARALMSHRLFAPLLEFRMDAERLEFEPGLSIVKMSQQDLNLHHSWEGAMGCPMSDTAVEAIVFLPKAAYYELMGQAGNPLELAYEKIYHLRDVLRLYQGARLGLEGIWTTTPGWGLWSFPASHHLDGREGYQSWGDTPFEFDIGHQDKLYQLWQAYRRHMMAKGLQSRALKVACQRFTAVYSPKTDEERLPELLAVPDALLRSGPQDSDYQFALRWAYLLAAGPDERERIWSALTTAQSLKQHITFGQQAARIELDGKLQSLREFNDMLGELVRPVLRIFLLSLLSKAKILEQLDACIVSGSPYLPRG